MSKETIHYIEVHKNGAVNAAQHTLDPTTFILPKVQGAKTALEWMKYGAIRMSVFFQCVYLI